MPWSVVNTLGIDGSQVSTRTLVLTGLDYDAPTTYTKANASVGAFIGEYKKVATRTATLETYGAPNTAIGPETYELPVVEVTANSPSGTPTFSGKALQVQFVGDNFTRLISGTAKPADGSPRYQRVLRLCSITTAVTNGTTLYAYVSGGVTSYTGVSATASAAPKSYAVGHVLKDDPSTPGNKIVSISPDVSAPNGEKAPCIYNLPAGANLLTNVFSDTAKVNFSAVQSSTYPLFYGPVIAIDRTSGTDKMAFQYEAGNYLGSVVYDNHQFYFENFFHPPVPVSIATPISPFGFTSPNYVSFTSYTGVTTGSNGRPDSIIIKIPVIKPCQPFSSGVDYSDIEDFAVDTTLPAPFGPIRIVWVSGIPCICKQTTDTVAPYSGYALNNATRSRSDLTMYKPSMNPLRIYSVNTNPMDGFPYALSNLHNKPEGIYELYALPSECLPTNSLSMVMPKAGVSATAATFQWAYYSCVTRGYVATGPTVACTAAGTSWVGTLPPPTPPSGYAAGSWTVIATQTVYGTTEAGNYMNYCHQSSGNYPLQAYPFALLARSWLSGDSDYTPVTAAGWIDIPRTVCPTITWSGTPLVSWSANTITFDCRPLVPSAYSTESCELVATACPAKCYAFINGYWNDAQYNNSSVADISDSTTLTGSINTFYKPTPAGSDNIYICFSKYAPLVHAMYPIASSFSYNPPRGFSAGICAASGAAAVKVETTITI